MDKKERIEEAIFELNKVVFIRPTALQLHRSRGAMLGRVQRKEDKRYWEMVQKKKVKLEQQLLDLKSEENQDLMQQSSFQNEEKILLPKETLTRIKTKPRLRMGRYGY